MPHDGSRIEPHLDPTDLESRIAQPAAVAAPDRDDDDGVRRPPPPLPRRNHHAKIVAALSALVALGVSAMALAVFLL